MILPDPDTRHLRAVAPVQDNSTATAIRAVGSLFETAQVVNTAKKQQAFEKEGESLRTGLTELSDDFVTQTAKEFEETLRKQKKLPASEYRIRREAMIREYTKDRSADEVDHLMRISRQVDGVTGEAVRQEELRQREKQVAQQQFLKEWTAEGFDPAKINDPDEQRKYRSLKEYKKEANIIAAELEFKQNKRDIASFDVKTDLQTIVNALRVDLGPAIDQLAISKFGKSLNQVTDEDIATLKVDERAEFIRSMDTKKAEMTHQIRTLFSGYSGLTDANYEAALKPLYDTIDLYKARVDRKATLDDVNYQVGLMQSLVQKKIIDTPAGLRLHLYTSLFPNAPISPEMGAQMLKSIGDVMDGKLVNGFLGETKEDRTQSRNTLVKVFKGLNQSDLSEEQKTIARDVISGFTRNSVANYDDMSVDQKDVMIDLFTNKDLAEVIKGDSNTRKLTEVANNYFGDVFVAMEQRLQEDLAGHAGGQRSQKKIPRNRLINMTIENGAIVVTPKGKTERARRAATAIGNYTSRLNKVAKAGANLTGEPVKNVLATMLERFDTIGLGGSDE